MDKLIKKLSKEYTRYEYIQKILKLERHPKYTEAIYEFLLLSTYYKYISLSDFNIIDEIFVKLDKKHIVLNPIYNLVCYEFLSNNEIDNLVDKIIKLVDEYLALTFQYKTINYEIKGNWYSCSKFN